MKVPCGGFKIDDDTLKLKEDGTLYAAGGGGVQPDWNQNDSTAADYVKNRPLIATNDDILNFLVDIGMVVPVTNLAGEILISSSDEIYYL